LRSCVQRFPVLNPCAFRHLVLEAGHPRDHLWIGDVVRPRIVTSISPGDAGLLLQRVHVPERTQVLRHQLLDSEVTAVCVSSASPDDRHGEPDGQHAAGPRQREPEGAPRAVGKPLLRTIQPGVRASFARRSGVPGREKRVSAAKPAHTAQASAMKMPTTSSAPKPRNHRHRRQEQDEEAGGRGHAGCEDGGPAGP
jgi:hypothetical protein